MQGETVGRSLYLQAAARAGITDERRAEALAVELCRRLGQGQTTQLREWLATSHGLRGATAQEVAGTALVYRCPQALDVIGR